MPIPSASINRYSGHMHHAACGCKGPSLQPQNKLRFGEEVKNESASAQATTESTSAEKKEEKSFLAGIWDDAKQKYEDAKKALREKLTELKNDALNWIEDQVKAKIEEARKWSQEEPPRKEDDKGWMADIQHAGRKAIREAAGYFVNKAAEWLEKRKADREKASVESPDTNLNQQEAPEKDPRNGLKAVSTSASD